MHNTVNRLSVVGFAAKEKVISGFESTRFYSSAFCCVVFAVQLFYSSFVHSAGQYESVEGFVKTSFTGREVSPQLLWLTKALKAQASIITGKNFTGLRLRYWRHLDKTVWVLEEIGKELPITMAISVDSGGVVDMRVLEYRESRGAEIRHRFFTEQFFGVTLTQEQKLSRSIDGISGATLSVRASKNMARLALLFHNAVVGEQFEQRAGFESTNNILNR